MKGKPQAERGNPSCSSVWVFLALVFCLSWPFLLVGFGWLDPEQDVLRRYLFSCLGMLMVAASAFLTRAFVERRGFQDVGWNPGRLKWYGGILLFCALLWLGPPLVALFCGRLEWVSNLSQDERMVVVLSLVGFSVLAGFGEEFGWRGYLLPRLLLDRWQARWVLLTIGFVWGVWHCALAVGPLLRAVLDGTPGWPSMIGPALVGCARMIGACLALSPIFGALWLRTQSIFLVSFLHGCWIGIRDAASHLLRYPSALRLITLALVLAAWLVAVLWVERYRRTEIGSDGEF